MTLEQYQEIFNQRYANFVADQSITLDVYQSSPLIAAAINHWQKLMKNGGKAKLLKVQRLNQIIL